MFVELIESLRCPRAHEESPLVASTTRSESRHIVDGVLGCPVCGAEFVIAKGVAHFDALYAPPRTDQPSAEAAMRLAAFLELTEPRGFALVCGRWGAHADQIRRLSDTPLVLVNPPAGAEDHDVAGVIRVGDVLPLAPASARAAALDEQMPSALIDSVVRSVRVGGRVVGGTAQPLPDGVTELVRDDREWVAERAAASPPTSRLVSIKLSRSAEP